MTCLNRHYYVLSRALVAMYEQPAVAERAIFRGGTALHKLFFQPAGRCSEDIDLVRRDTGRIGELIDAIRDVLDPWLGKPKWKLLAGALHEAGEPPSGHAA